MNEIRLKVSDKDVNFSFEKLNNQFIFIKILKEGEKKFPNFLKRIENLNGGNNIFSNLEIIDYLADNLLPLCKSHDFTSRDRIEEFFGEDYEAYLGLIIMTLGFVSKPFQKKK